jgi:uncharacterized lipoprotein YddW (UPF0748 family)
VEKPQYAGLSCRRSTTNGEEPLVWFVPTLITLIALLSSYLPPQFYFLQHLFRKIFRPFAFEFIAWASRQESMNHFGKNILQCAALFFTSACIAQSAANYELSTTLPPKVAREFRGAWIATVANIDWPSKPGLSTAQQKAELILLLNRAQQLKLNAVIFQVRPACDAFYDSKIEPWSEYLTGVMGKAPEPFYDPLAFAIQEAHKCGLELHAWFNPYRALHKSHEGKVSRNHISKTRPELVRRFGQYLWLDPGEREVQEYSLSVVMDVVKRYDIDGVQFDDYFYLSAEDAGIKNQDFPDDRSWKKYGEGGGLSRDDWRRENVNGFVERVYRSIKAAKPWVKFGISPFGIWRPGYPPQIKGSDATIKYFADSRKWLMNGWVDYLAPQLYWPINQTEQSFPALLDWWADQNPKGRSLWPGLSVANAGKWKPDEIPNQIRLTRKQTGASGYILYDMKSLLLNSPLCGELERSLNSEAALVRASSWLGNSPPGKPSLSLTVSAGNLKATWNSSGTNAARWWVLQTKSFNDWKTEIFAADVVSKVFNTPPEAIAITAIDRVGNASVPWVLQRKQKAPPSNRILLKKN